MKKTVKLLIVMQLLILFGISSCKKDEVFINNDTSLHQEVKQNPEGKIVLGKKLKNAYSVENMRKAYESLKAQNKLKSISSDEIDIRANCLYVRFLPKDSTDLNILWNDTSLELFDYPLDYEIKEEGYYYQDPDIPKGQPTWQYTVVPVDYVFPDIEHEVIEECFIPDEDSEEKKLKSSDYKNLLAAIEYESMKLTDNLTAEEKEQSNLKSWGWWPSKKNPTGYIKVYNTSKGLEGVMRVKVRTHRIVNISSTYTNENGYYRIPRGYRFNNVHYALIFKNATGFKIWGNWAFLAPARYNMGWHSKTGYSKEIYTNSKAWLWSTVNNGTYIYREKLCPKFGINKPPSSLRLWTVRSGGENLGSAPMARQISLSSSSLHDLLIGLGVTWGTWYMSLVMPDIFIIKNFKNTKEAYSTIFHELSHASHYTKAGKWYWLKYIAGIIDNGGDYGDGTGGNDGYIGVGEMWGNYFGYICEKYYFGSAGLGGTNDWYQPFILYDIDNNIYGMTPHKIFTCLQSNVRSHQELKSKLISYYGHSSQINQIFSNYGF